MVYRIVLFLLLGSVVHSCVMHRQWPDKPVMVSLEKTPCMGDCPVYTLKIYSDRYAILEGKMFVQYIGKHITRLSVKEMGDMERKFAESDFFSFESEYVKRVTDLPTTYIFYNNGRETKRIKDYYGAPEALKELEREVERLLETQKWRKIRGKQRAKEFQEKDLSSPAGCLNCGS